MTVRYHRRGDRSCFRVTSANAIGHTSREQADLSEHPAAKALDQAIGQLLVDMVTPMALQGALAVQKELEARSVECDALRRKEVERARYDSDLARRRVSVSARHLDSVLRVNDHRVH